VSIVGKKWKWWLLAGGFILLLAIIAVPTVSWMRLPRYQGRTVAFWWDEYIECERMPRGRPAGFSPQFYETRFHRMTNAAAAFRTKDPRVGEFLLGMVSPGRLQGILFTTWGRLPSSWRNGLKAWGPLDPRQQGWLAHSLLQESPELIVAVKSNLLKLLLASETDNQMRDVAFSLISMSRSDLSDSMPELAALLKSMDPRVAAWAVSKLQSAAAREFAPDVRTAIRGKRIPASAGIHCLLAMGQPVWSSLGALNEELSSTNIVPFSALYCVPKLGENRKYVLSGLSNILHHPDARFVASAIKVLNGLGEDARPLAPAFIEELDNPWYFLRAESVKTLESIGGAEFRAAEAKLRAMQMDEHPDVSNAVHHALILLGAPPTD
jgi:hypothetical protein